MAKYLNALPQRSGEIFLTDGGIETTLIFHDGFELPCFAAFDLLKSPSGKEALHRYYQTYATLAGDYGVGCILESATWRASSDWGDKLGYSAEQLAEANSQAIALLYEIRQAHETRHTPIVISGCVGPRGDGYNPDTFLTDSAAKAYHLAQVTTFRDAGADLVTGMTMTHTGEAIGIVRAAKAVGMPAALSFTVETDGRLPSGKPLGEAIEEVDAATDAAPVYYMINCAHPSHFMAALEAGGAWRSRIHGLRANASAKSHAELDEATRLDEGNPEELAQLYGDVRRLLPNLNVFGGCCGTDAAHVEAICKVVLAA
ncbi:homocysteine S-methyltransferase [Marinobacter halodurans]|uniref:Homocysteine S-methyltransferase n=1 Tax=Marinobacter halodurans TaxID=2528979 RepID=A0ABY1ZH21_9GAMM|nr:homocysteine S-methyltransferase family protein [Marinobacter halodurans]TBW49376.1 homocysteine S-methyltransferase [Marinobacter halodurans]